MVVSSSPTPGYVLIAQILESASDSVSLSLSASPLLMLCLYLLKVNIKKKKKRMGDVSEGCGCKERDQVNVSQLICVNSTLSKNYM